LLVIATINGACVIGVQFVLYALAPGYYPESLRGIGSGAAVAAGGWGRSLAPMVLACCWHLAPATSGRC
jgi:AAHS family 3-hydroxyphenylpropionic acid transporter